MLFILLFHICFCSRIHLIWPKWKRNCFEMSDLWSLVWNGDVGGGGIVGVNWTEYGDLTGKSKEMEPLLKKLSLKSFFRWFLKWFYRLLTSVKHCALGIPRWRTFLLFWFFLLKLTLITSAQLFRDTFVRFES